MTSNIEDYLKAIYSLGGSHKLVSNKDIARDLGIAPASVTEMLGKLQKQGFIAYTPYKGSRLTDLGLESCIDLVRAHRLWEVFLIRHLGYSWSEAHEEAHLLEHAAPVRMVDRLDQFLNYPAYCPHGSAIPKSSGFDNQPSLYPLAELEAGDTATIRRVIEKKALLDYLQPLGIAIGEPVRVVKKEPYEGSVTLETSSKQIEISHKAAAELFVSREEPTQI